MLFFLIKNLFMKALMSSCNRFYQGVLMNDFINQKLIFENVFVFQEDLAFHLVFFRIINLKDALIFYLIFFRTFFFIT